MDPQAKAPALQPASSTLGISGGYTYTLGSCVVEVVGTAINYPEQPDPDNALNRSTAVLSMGTPVRMANGAVWSVWRPPGMLQTGGIQVQLKGVQRSTVTFNVTPDCLEEPIWNVGYPVPVPPPEPPPVEVPSPEPAPESDVPPDPVEEPSEEVVA